jgi:hypothetical protein
MIAGQDVDAGRIHAAPNVEKPISIIFGPQLLEQIRDCHLDSSTC